MKAKSRYRKLKATLIVLATLIIAFVVYVEIVNRNSKNMTYRQKVMKAIYPAIMWFSRMTGKNSTELDGEKKSPVVSFYTLSAKLNNGSILDFSALKGKKVMLVNTASNCGYTNQYEDLQKLSEQYKDKLVVIGFPANDFKEQEKGSDEDIATFCKINYGVSFPLATKSVVIKSAEQNPVYQWLSDSTKNGWNNKTPSWNFSKYIVDEEGKLINYFGPAVSPLSKDITSVL